MRSVLKNKVLVSVIAILLLANIAMLVFLITGMKTPERAKGEANKNPHPTINFLQSKMEFNDEQLNQFKDLKKEHYLKLSPLFEDLRKTKDEFFMMVKDSVSEDSMDSVASLIGQKQKNLDMQVFRTVKEVRKICNQKQQEKFDSLLPKIAYKMVGSIRKGNAEDSLKKSQ